MTIRLRKVITNAQIAFGRGKAMMGELYQLGKDMQRIFATLERIENNSLGAQIMAKLSDLQASVLLVLTATGALQTSVTGIQETIDAEQAEILAKIEALEAIIRDGDLGPEADALLEDLKTAAVRIGAASAALAAASTDLAGTVQAAPEVGPSAPPATPVVVAGSDADHFGISVGITDDHSETLLRVDNGGTGTFTDHASFPPSFDFPDPKPTQFTADLVKAGAGIQVWKAVNTKDGLFSAETETITTEDGVLVV